jgi:hypothetical protein
LRDKVVAALGSEAPRAATRENAGSTSGFSDLTDNPSTTAAPNDAKTSDTASQAPPTGAASIPSCQEQLARLAPGTTSVLEARGMVDGAPVWVFVRSQSEGGRLLVVLNGDCALLNEQRMN